jgi:hypothetical protein
VYGLTARWNPAWNRLEIMDLAKYFQERSRYNRMANEWHFATCARLDETEYRKPGAAGKQQLLRA